MRQIITISVAAVFILCLGINEASAEGLKGEEIKQRLIGNTIYWSSTNIDNVKKTYWTYYKDATTRITQEKRVKRQRERWRDYTTEWSVTKDGKYCHLTRRGKKNCRTNVRISGNTVTMDGIGGAPSVKYELLKGNPRKLKE